MANDPMQQLHDRATRGQSLTPEEQAQLSEWYARLDREETAALSRAGTASNLEALREQVIAATARLGEASRRIAELSAENEVLRREIAVLQAQLAQRPKAQPA